MRSPLMSIGPWGAAATAAIRSASAFAMHAIRTWCASPSAAIVVAKTRFAPVGSFSPNRLTYVPDVTRTPAESRPSQRHAY